MPALLAALRGALLEWQAAEGSAFVYDGRDQVRCSPGGPLAWACNTRGKHPWWCMEGPTGMRYT